MGGEPDMPRIPAALFSTMVDGVFHGMTFLHKGSLDIGEAVTELNRFLLSKSGLRKFVTSILGILEPDGSIHYVNAGHDPGILLRRNGQTEDLPSGGTILGIFEDVQYTSRHLQLECGDELVLYSDGITQSRNAAGQDT